MNYRWWKNLVSKYFRSLNYVRKNMSWMIKKNFNIVTKWLQTIKKQIKKNERNECVSLSIFCFSTLPNLNLLYPILALVEGIHQKDDSGFIVWGIFYYGSFLCWCSPRSVLSSIFEFWDTCWACNTIGLCVYLWLKNNTCQNQWKSFY